MEKFVELAMEVVRSMLSDVYGFTEGEEEEYVLVVKQDDEQMLVIDIDAGEDATAILIGKGGLNHEAFQRICYSALGTRFESQMESQMPRPFFVTVNGRRPEFRNGHSTASAPPKLVTIIVPPGVEVRTRTEGGGPKAPRRR